MELKPMTPNDLMDILKDLRIGEPIWLEQKNDSMCDVYPARIVGIETIYPPHDVNRLILWIPPNEEIYGIMFSYNKTWRLWPSQPSVEESRAAPWIS